MAPVMQHSIMWRPVLNKQAPGKGTRKLEIVLIGFAASFYLLCITAVAAFADVGATAHHSSRDVAAIAPAEKTMSIKTQKLPQTFSLKSLKPEERNGDYLRHVTNPVPDEQSLNQVIFQKEIASEMQSRYNSYHSNFEKREHYLMNDTDDYLREQQANQDLVDWTMKRLLQHHLEYSVMKRVEKSAKEEAHAVRKPEKMVPADPSKVSAVAKAEAPTKTTAPVQAEEPKKAEQTASTASSGKSQFFKALLSIHKAFKGTTVNIGDHVKTSVKYDFPRGMMRFGLISPVADANVEYRLKPVNPTSGPVIQQPEKLMLNVGKNFKFLKASANANYGLVSGNLNYGVSKQLIGPLSAQIDQVSNRRDHSHNQTFFRLNLGTSF